MSKQTVQSVYVRPECDSCAAINTVHCVFEDTICVFTPLFLKRTTECRKDVLRIYCSDYTCGHFHRCVYKLIVVGNRWRAVFGKGEMRTWLYLYSLLWPLCEDSHSQGDGQWVCVGFCVWGMVHVCQWAVKAQDVWGMRKQASIAHHLYLLASLAAVCQLGPLTTGWLPGNWDISWPIRTRCNRVLSSSPPFQLIMLLCHSLPGQRK